MSSPGRAAYEAFAAKLDAVVTSKGRGEPELWTKLPLTARRAWDAAAEAAVSTHLENVIDKQKRRSV